ncbi:TetR/AcrR family transcriptional regulator [Sciscionella sediminilitoris]|uniref:TetR/AcrR family transcriptional regulator n=1 Tax=Sciscionella sediminilitoris TaxID=1445613 RepID=UPI0004DF5198|nr:TetR/AcrR family transcriptional regulator [Sciscionella sp. SE31]
MAETEDSTRERILAAAQDLFARHGFDATPTSKIATEAQVPKGLVHYYFNRKPDLLTALVDKLPSEHVELGEVVVDGDVCTSLCRFVDRLDRNLDGSSLLSHLLWREADTHEVVRDALQARYRKMVAQIGEVITAASRHRIAAERISAAAALLAHALSFRHSMARHDGGAGHGDGASMDAEVRFVAEALAS